jgi:hypothetical protein
VKLFTDYQLAIIRFCAEECARQNSGEESVAWMVNAYVYAVERFSVQNTISEEDVLAMAAMIEPKKNANGYRKVPVSFRTGEVVGWENIERQIGNVLGAQDVLEPVEFYTEFEKVHPHEDGNGRLGAILYNVKNGTLYCPVAPPDVFAQQ